MTEKFIIALIFILFDILTGVTVAIKLKQLQSKKMRTGLFNKIAIIFTMFFSVLIDKSHVVNVCTFNFVLIYIVFMECTSIIENIKKLNKNAIPKELEKIIKEKGE